MLEGSEAVTSPAGGDGPAGMELRRLGGAAALMMAAVFASRAIGYLREAYIAYAFGASGHTDAYNVAFTIPDWLNYLVAGGALSITFITIFSPYVAERREEEGYRVFSIVTTFMILALGIGVVIAEIFTPQLLRLYVPSFRPGQLAECARMTRILLPAQLCFGVGGLICSTLYTRGVFWLPALAPLFYSSSIIAGGVFLHHWLGIESLAVGALAGAFLGPFLFPLLGARKRGLRYRPSMAFRDPAFLRWLKLTLPLMAGVTLVSADDWIIRPLGAAFFGAITELTYAKQLMRVPMAVLGQAVGQATMPFFASLAAQGKWEQLRETLDKSVVRTVTGAVLATSYLAGLALPITRVVYERGKFHDGNAHSTALYLTIFVLSLAFWAAQTIYSRAFYAAGNTLTPMLAGTIVTAVMIPLYIFLAHRLQVPGLALASDIGITVNVLVLVYLLHRRNWLGAAWSRWRLVPRVMVAAAIAGVVVFEFTLRLEGATYHGLRELGLLLGASLLWLALVYALARLLGLQELMDESWRLARRVFHRVGILAPRGEGGP